MRTAAVPARGANALVRSGLWFCACSLLTAALSAQCTNPTQIPNQTISSGTQPFYDNNALEATGVVINGTASVSMVAGNCIHFGTGFRATAPTSGAATTTLQAWVEAAPSLGSLAPASGSGSTQPFTFTASSPAGYSNLSSVEFLLNTTRTGLDGCYIRYSGNALYLANNQGTTWLGGVAPGSSGTVSNSYCSISGSGASVTVSGTTLSATVPVTFQSVFAGPKNEYAIAYDADRLSSGWQQMGTWTVPGTPVGPDFSVAAVPELVYIPAGVQTTASYTITVTPLNGFSGAVSFSASPFWDCWSPFFNPAQVSGPSWTSTLSMPCKNWLPSGYWTTMTAWAGGKSHDLTLSLGVTQTQPYRLATVINPPGAGTLTLDPPGGWYSAGSRVMITAAAAAGYQLQNVSGVTYDYGSSWAVFMDGDRTVTANFTQTAVIHTLTTAPVTGLSLTVDGTACTSPCTFTWTPGSSHTITTPGIQPAGTGTQYVFTNWSDAIPAATRTITAPSTAATWTANFNTQYYLTTTAGSGGTIAPPSGWYNKASLVAISAAPNSGYVFTGFSGAVTGTTTPQNLTVNGPATVAANFSQSAGFTVSQPPTLFVAPGGSTSATLTVAAFGGFSQDVTFSSSNLPSGLLATFTPSRVGPNGSTQVTFSAAAGMARLTYQVNLQATGGAVQQTVSVIVTVGFTVREYIRLRDRIIAIENVRK